MLKVPFCSFGGSVVKNPSANAGDEGLIPVGKNPGRRKCQSTLIFLPRKSYGQRNLVGYSPWGCKRVRHDLASK